MSAKSSRRQVLRACCSPVPASATLSSAAERPVVEEPAMLTPLAQTILDWTLAHLYPQGVSKPVAKRLALLVTGLVAGENATVSEVTTTLHGLGITPAKRPSIARRVARLLDDPRLDPTTLLPVLAQALAPEWLRGAVAAHAANERAGAAHHRRFRPIELVLDATTKDDQVHLLVIGVGYQGLVLPLAVRVWQQNAPLAPGDYWCHLHGLLLDAQAALPPELRDHVVLLADRFFGIPRMVDLLSALDWDWVLRIQDQTQVRLPDGTVQPVRALVRRPGDVWCPGTAPTVAPTGPEPLAVFKGAGWRQCQVAAAWLVGEAEPWLLITSLPATLDRFRDYARRWAIERLFLSWKAHGWDLEASGLTAPAKVGRLLTGLVVATYWRIAVAIPATTAYLAELTVRAAGRPVLPRQLALPFFPAPPPPDTRPWGAKFSLFTWGYLIIRDTDCRTTTPARCWVLPDWDAPTWSQHCQQVYDGAA